MEGLAELHAKLDRKQTEIEKGVANLVEQTALIADRLTGGKDVSRSRELLATLEEAHRLHVYDRDRMRTKAEAMGGKNWP